MRPDKDHEQFAHLIRALDPWLHEAVIVGGWAHRLYRYHESAQPLGYSPLMTVDADVALPSAATLGTGDIRDRLLANGFHEEFLGDARPPVTHYRLGQEDQSFYVEFLTPLIGSGFTRAKVPDFTASVRGVSAQKVRYLAILLNDPWLVRLDESLGFPLPEPKLVRLPNAAGYLAQKLLSYSQRKPSDRAKDVLYIHDTIETFGRALPKLRQTWLTSVRPQLHKKAVRVIELAGNNMFSPIDDTIRNAARMTPGRDLSPQLILEVCELGVREIFG